MNLTKKDKKTLKKVVKKYGVDKAQRMIELAKKYDASRK